MVIAATNQAIAEALTLAEASGIDRAAAYDTLASSAISSPFIHYKRQAYLAPDDGAVAFTTALISKDLELALGMAGDLQLPVTAAARQFLDATCAADLGNADFASVPQALRQQTRPNRQHAGSSRSAGPLEVG